MTMFDRAKESSIHRKKAYLERVLDGRLPVAQLELVPLRIVRRVKRSVPLPITRKAVSKSGMLSWKTQASSKMTLDVLVADVTRFARSAGPPGMRILYRLVNGVGTSFRPISQPSPSRTSWTCQFSIITRVSFS